MKFEKGNKFGTKGKRGQARITSDVKDKLMEFHDEALKGLEAGVKSGDFQYIKLWYDLMIPKMRSTEIDMEVSQKEVFGLDKKELDNWLNDIINDK